MHRQNQINPIQMANRLKGKVINQFLRYSKVCILLCTDVLVSKIRFDFVVRLSDLICFQRIANNQNSRLSGTVRSGQRLKGWETFFPKVRYRTVQI